MVTGVEAVVLLRKPPADTELMGSACSYGTFCLLTRTDTKPCQIQRRDSATGK